MVILGVARLLSLSLSLSLSVCLPVLFCGNVGSRLERDTTTERDDVEGFAAIVYARNDVIGALFWLAETRIVPAGV